VETVVVTGVLCEALANTRSALRFSRPGPGKAAMRLLCARCRKRDLRLREEPPAGEV